MNAHFNVCFASGCDVFSTAACLPANAAVSLFGLLETGVRWTNHNAPGAGNKVEMNSGVWQGSRSGNYGPSCSAFVSVDPIAARNIGAVNSFSPLFGVRFDNSIRYAITIGRVTTTYQEDRGLTCAGHASYMVGGTYGFDRVKLFAGFANTRFDTGFATSPKPANSLAAQGGRDDKPSMAEARFALSPFWEATFGYYTDRVGDVAVDCNRRSDGVDVSGGADQTDISLNVRHVF